jgi:hypothetical protein
MAHTPICDRIPELGARSRQGAPGGFETRGVDLGPVASACLRHRCDHFMFLTPPALGARAERCGSPEMRESFRPRGRVEEGYRIERSALK